jgi:hypothetical protein
MSNLDGFLLSLMFATATLAMPGEAGMGKAHALPFEGAWSELITMDRGNCDPIDRLGVDIRDGALQYAGDSAVSIRGPVVGDGRVRVRLANGNQSASGSGKLSASSGTGTWHGTGLASLCAGAGRLNAAELAVAALTWSELERGEHNGA